MRSFEAFSYTVCKASHKYSETQKPKKERIKEAISVILIGVEDPVIDYWVAL